MQNGCEIGDRITGLFLYRLYRPKENIILKDLAHGLKIVQLHFGPLPHILHILAHPWQTCPTWWWKGAPKQEVLWYFYAHFSYPVFPDPIEWVKHKTELPWTVLSNLSLAPSPKVKRWQVVISGATYSTVANDSSRFHCSHGRQVGTLQDIRRYWSFRQQATRHHATGTMRQSQHQ